MFLEHQEILNPRIIKFSEGSCDIEFWSNDCFAITGKITFKWILKYKAVLLNCTNISQYCCFYFILIK